MDLDMGADPDDLMAHSTYGVCGVKYIIANNAAKHLGNTSRLTGRKCEQSLVSFPVVIAFRLLLDAKVGPSRRDSMADDLKKRGSPDSKTINMHEAWEKEYWKKKFHVTGQQLAGAVRAVGKSVAKVEKYLKDR